MASVQLHIVVLAFMLTMVAGDSVSFRSCPGSIPPPKDVRVAGCSSTPCKLPRGQDAAMEADFDAPSYVENLTAHVLPLAGAVPLPYQLPAKYSNACNWLRNSVSCPIEAGTAVTHHLLVPVLQAYPRIPLTIQVSLTDEQERPLFCFRTNIRVV